MHQGPPNRLRHEEKILNSAVRTAIEASKSEHLLCLIRDLNDNRFEENKFLNDRSQLIRDSIRTLQKNIASKDKIKNADVQIFEKHIQEICDLITNFKGLLQNHYDFVKGQEEGLEEEVKYFQRFSFNLDTASFYKSLSVDAVSRVNTVRKRSSNKDINDFQEFLYNNGGHTGGWGMEEHKMFLKSCHKFRLHKRHYWDACDSKEMIEDFGLNEEQFTNDVQLKIPDKTDQDIRIHLKWLLNYNYLKNKKSQALNIWKLSKTASSTPDVLSKEDSFKNIIAYYQNSKNKLTEWKKLKNIEDKTMLEEKAEIVIRQNEMQDMAKTKSKKRKGSFLKKSSVQKVTEPDLEAKSKEKLKRIDARNKIHEFQLRDQTRMDNRKQLINKYRQVKTANVSAIRQHSKIDTRMDRCISAFTEQWRRRIAKSCPDISQGNKYHLIKSVDEIPKLRTPNWCRDAPYILR